MIGTNIRGFRHLIRMAKTLNGINFIYKYEHFCIGIGIAIYVHDDNCSYLSGVKDYLMIFNTTSSNIDFNPSAHYGKENANIINDAYSKYPNLYVLPVNKDKYNNEESHFFKDKVCLPKDFDDRYAEFCEANKKQLATLAKYADKECAPFKYIFALSNGSKNFFLWAVNAMYKQGVSIYLIEKILKWNSKYSQLSKLLKKGTITAYNSNSDIIFLSLEQIKLRRDKRVNDVINMFNTVQKKALKAASLSNRDYETLSKFAKLSNKKKNNFIRKMSTIEDSSEILKQMSFLADVHFSWNKDSLLEFIKNTDNFNCEIIIDRGDIILLKVNDYETVKRLAKTTNWCISKDKKYWDEYVEKKSMATQYVLMDFSKNEDDNLSIVGFTSIYDRGITNAHDFQNNNIMEGRRINKIVQIKSFLPEQNNSRNIYGILDKYGIKLSDVVSYAPSQYEWNRDSMFDYLTQCISEYDYYIIADYGDKVAFIAESDDVKYFLGDAYIEQRRNHGICGNQYIIFADFTKDANDPEKLTFGIISYNKDEQESNCVMLYNDRAQQIQQSFDAKLEEYGLPYDIICRKDNIVHRFYSALSSLDLSTVKDLIKNDDVRKSILKKERLTSVIDVVRNVTFGYNSSDYIDLFCDNGFAMSDVIGIRQTTDVVRTILDLSYDNIRHGVAFASKVPTEKNIDDLRNGRIKNFNNAYSIGLFLMLMKIISTETSKDILYRITEYIYGKNSCCDLHDLIITEIFNKIGDTDSNYGIANLIVNYAFINKRNRIINPILLKAKKDPTLKTMIDSFNGYEVKTTEMWVKRGENNYIIENHIEEAVTYANS